MNPTAAGWASERVGDVRHVLADGAVVGGGGKLRSGPLIVAASPPPEPVRRFDPRDVNLRFVDAGQLPELVSAVNAGRQPRPVR